MKKGYIRKNGLIYFLNRGKRKTFWFLSKMQLEVIKKENLKRHHDTHHSELQNLDGELRKMKIEEKKDLHAQQSVMTSFCSTNDNMLTVSYEVLEWIGKKLKP